MLTRWLRESPSAECHPVAYGGKKQTTPPKEYDDAGTMELLARGAAPRTLTMVEMVRGATPGIKPQTDGAVAIAGIADAVSASDYCCSCGWPLSCDLGVSY